MSHEITERDGLVLASKPAWHGLGTVLPEAPTVEEAMQVAGLDWTVEACPLQATVPLTGKERKELEAELGGAEITNERRSAIRSSLLSGLKKMDVASHVANVRLDTGEVLGVVGSQYELLQNRSLAEAVVAVSEFEADKVEIESAGSIKGGRRVWFLARSKTIIEVGKGDRVIPYCLFANGHDGTMSCSIFPTSVRVVCKNTMDAATCNLSRQQAAGYVFNWHHKGDIAAKVEGARAALQAAMRGLDEHGRTVEAMASARFKADAPITAVGAAVALTQQTVQAAGGAVGDAVSSGGRVMSARDKVVAFYVRVYEATWGAIPTKVTCDKEERRVKKATKVVAEWLANFEDPAHGSDLGVGGTVWAAFNGVTRWADHDKTARVTKAHGTKDSAQAYSRLFGSAAALKNNAARAAIDLIG